jgi:hypothetical protein
MATVIAKTYVIPVIAAVRLTCAGLQYVVETPEFIDVVTVQGAHIACTCHEANCEHIRIVTIRRAQDAAKDAQRASLEASFDLTYGDSAA